MTTRVWYENDAIQMDGVGAMPARSLVTALDGDRVHVLTLCGVRLSQLVYGEYARKDGTGFTSAAAAQAYLDGEFAKAPAVSVAWSAVTDRPVTFPPATHTHPWGDITGKPTSYPPATHTHSYNDLIDKPTIPPASGRLVLLGTITVAETLLVSLAVGMKRKAFTLQGVATTDALIAIPTGAPTSGCEVVNAYPAGANSVSVGYYTPVLAIGASYSIPVGIYRLT